MRQGDVSRQGHEPQRLEVILRQTLDRGRTIVLVHGTAYRLTPQTPAPDSGDSRELEVGGIIGVQDKTVSVGCMVAIVLWTLTVILLGISVALANDNVGRIGLALSAAAATATIRTYFVRQNQLMRALAKQVDEMPQPRLRRL